MTTGLTKYIRVSWVTAALALWLCLISGDFVDAADRIEVTAAVDKQTAYIADVIDYTISITYDSAIQLTPPAAGANLGGFDVKDYDFGEETTLEDGRRQQVLRFKLRTFTTGEYVIPPLPIEYILPDSTRKYISADPIKINIKSVLAEGANADTLQLRPLKEQFSLAAGSKTTWIIIVAVVVVGVAVAAFFWYRRRKAAQETPFVDLRPSWEIAYSELALLKEQNLLAQGEVKRFYFELSDIMKRYLGRKFEFNAIDMTTVEIGDALAERSLDGDLHRDIMAFFENADLVKFAKYVPPEDRPQADWNDAYELVTRSKDIIVTAPIAVLEPVMVLPVAGATEDDDSDLKYAPPELREILASRPEEDKE